jgi:hypothetical protein
MGDRPGVLKLPTLFYPGSAFRGRPLDFFQRFCWEIAFDMRKIHAAGRVGPPEIGLTIGTDKIEHRENPSVLGKPHVAASL